MCQRSVLCNVTFIFLCGLPFHSAQVDLSFVLKVMQAFKATSRLNIHCHIESKSIAETFKASEQLLTVGTLTEISPDENVLWCLHDFNETLLHKQLNSCQSCAVRNVWLVEGSSINIEKAINSVRIDINRRVLLMHQDTSLIEEVYNINNQAMRTTLGRINGDGTFIWKERQEFLNRRSDFRGLRIKAGTLKFGKPFSYVTADRTTILNYDHDSSLEGIYPEVLRTLSDHLNFSLDFRISEDLTIGYPLVKDGTIVGYSGLIGNLFAGKIEVISYPIQHDLVRYGIMEFMHGMGSRSGALIVSASSGSEVQDIVLYLLPFKTNLWLVFAVNSVVISISLCLFKICSSKRKCQSNPSLLLKWAQKIFLVSSSYFGNSFNKTWHKLSSASLLLFAIFISGILVDRSYRASLTSELSVRRQKLPFDTPKGLYEAKFRVIHTYKQINQIMRLYQHSSSMSWIAKSYFEHGAEEFPSFASAMEELSKPYSHKAFFNTVEKFYMFPKYKCTAMLAWSSVATPSTMTLRLSSPYAELLRYSQLKSREMGAFNRIMNKHLTRNSRHSCPKEFKGSPLSVRKVIGAILLLAFSVAISFCFLMLEFLWFKIMPMQTLLCEESVQDSETHFKQMLDFWYKHQTSSKLRKVFEIELDMLVLSFQHNFKQNGMHCKVSSV